IGKILGYSAAWRIARGTMLRAAKRVNADLGRLQYIFRPEGIGVNQRAAAMPIFSSTLRVHDFGQRLRAIRADSAQYSACREILHRLVVGHVDVAERAVAVSKWIHIPRI